MIMWVYYGRHLVIWHEPYSTHDLTGLRDWKTYKEANYSGPNFFFIKCFNSGFRWLVASSVKSQQFEFAKVVHFFLEK